MPLFDTLRALFIASLLFLPWDPGPDSISDSEPDPLILVDLSAALDRNALGLAAALPDLEEPINAGSRRAALPADLVEVIDIGDSYCKTQGGCRTPGGQSIAGRDILVAKLSRRDVPGPKTAHLESSACRWPPDEIIHYGVDLNRNHGFKWSSSGHSTDPCEQTYYGRAPASEPETQAYEGILRQIFADQRGPGDLDIAPDSTMGMMINFHNFTAPGTVLVPWGWSTRQAPNALGMTALAERYIADNGYVWKNALYTTSGNTRDWAYGELGIPAYIIELEGDRFLTPCGAMPQILADNIPPLERFLNLADQPYRRIRGPEASLAAQPAQVVQGPDPYPQRTHLQRPRRPTADRGRRDELRPARPPSARLAPARP